MYSHMMTTSKTLIKTCLKYTMKIQYQFLCLHLGSEKQDGNGTHLRFALNLQL